MTKTILSSEPAASTALLQGNPNKMGVRGHCSTLPVSPGEGENNEKAASGAKR